MQKCFTRSLSSMDAIFDFVARFLAFHKIRSEYGFDINLIVEELVTNMVKYSSGGREEIAIELDHQGDQLIIRLRESDVEEFNITSVPPPNIDLPASERRVGGLGLHLVRQYADTISYEYRNRNSTITVTKRLGK
jgi:anti-sigma regulatory factor (Ser/Thr protein kinase)